jgi:hypothetical protein
MPAGRDPGELILVRGDRRRMATDTAFGLIVVSVCWWILLRLVWSDYRLVVPFIAGWLVASLKVIRTTWKPDLILSATGLELRRWGTTKFYAWGDITDVSVKGGDTYEFSELGISLPTASVVALSANHKSKRRQHIDPAAYHLQPDELVRMLDEWRASAPAMR